MTILPGARLGPYEVVASLGVGGMGEVYRGRDTRLDRNVAIKILPADFSANAALKARFEREARTISQLNHPHICILHDVGRENGTDFLVMELLEGDSLADRLARGALPVNDVLRYGIHISEALAAAHRQGIVHRDLKPGNVFLTRTGAKLLDFGLAKSSLPAVSLDSLTSLPTEHKPLTQEGTILGTFQYMAPEQLEGEEADARTDIFALGCVLYEMAAGKRAFQGKTRTSLIAAIVSGTPPPISSMQPLTPPALDHVIAKCLEKERDDRWQSAADVASELRWILDAGSQAGVAAPVLSRRRNRERVFWIAALIVAALGASVATYALRRETPRSPTFRSDLVLDPPVTPGTFSRPFAVSPDGRFVVYSAFQQEQDNLFLRRLDSLVPVAISGTRNAREPFVSPDGQWIGFRIGNSLRKIPSAGGPSQTIAEIDGWTPSWEEDGYIYLGSDLGIGRVPANGGTFETIVPAEVQGAPTTHSDPTLLPGEKKILFSRQRDADDGSGQIAVYDLKTKKTELIRPGGSPRYLATGHLLYSSAGALYAARFDPGSARLEGDPVIVGEGIATHPSTRQAFYDVSNRGVLAFLGGSFVWGTARLVWVDRNGRSELLPIPARPFAHPRIAPDGKSVVLAIREETTDVWSLDLVRATLSRLTFEPIENEMPNWLPDGSRIIFSSSRSKDPRAHFIKSADGTGMEEKIFSAAHHQHISSVSPDGKWMLITEFHPERATDIWLMSIDGKEKRPLLQTKFVEANAQFSPDGRWIAYASNESGRAEIYVIGHGGGGGKWPVSTDGGRNPMWSRDGRELFYISGDKMVAVGVTTSPRFSASLPKVLFQQRAETLPRGDTNYDVTPDGKRFLMIAADDETGPRPITVVGNWFDELNRLVPDK